MVLQTCNPTYTYKPLPAKDKIGTLLPCNVVVQETDTGKYEISSINPQTAISSVENDTITEIASEISEKLSKAINSL